MEKELPFKGLMRLPRFSPLNLQPLLDLADILDTFSQP
jgi:hypothetical protein